MRACIKPIIAALAAVTLQASAAASPVEEYVLPNIAYLGSYEEIIGGPDMVRLEDFEDELLVPGIELGGQSFYIDEGAVIHNAGPDRTLRFVFEDGITGFAGRSLLAGDEPFPGLFVEALFEDGSAQQLRDLDGTYGNGFYGIVADRPITAINFYGRGDAQSWRMLDVRFGRFSSGAPAVPEPASWAFMICGFGLTGMALRMKRPDKAYLL